MRSYLKSRSAKIALLTCCAALAVAGLVYRQDLRDAYARALRGPIPPEISRDEAKQEAANVGAAAGQEGAGTTGAAPTGAKVEDGVATNMTTGDGKAPVGGTPGDASATPGDARPASDLPAQINLQVAFMLQAPFHVWDALHEDACEEASALMLQAYDRGEKGPFSADEIDRRIRAVVAYEDATYGGDRDTDAATTAQFMRDFLGLKAATVLPISSADDIRRQIAAGRPVAVPMAGRHLHNPNFRNGGPIYHMLVLKGYRADGSFIANDPGTRVGADYVYDEATIMDAAHDWNGGDVEHGARVMIVVQD